LQDAAVDRAGFTEVAMAMLMRWISVKGSPMATPEFPVAHGVSVTPGMPG
jgi:hypothetical protein